jgi:hypothetical protein
MNKAVGSNRHNHRCRHPGLCALETDFQTLSPGLVSCLRTHRARPFWAAPTYLLNNPTPAESPRWGRRFVVGVAINGVLWGFAGFFFSLSKASLIHFFLPIFGLSEIAEKIDVFEE